MFGTKEEILLLLSETLGLSHKITENADSTVKYLTVELTLDGKPIDSIVIDLNEI